MPRSLVFTHAGDTFTAELARHSRDDLYGTVRVQTHDADGQPCRIATLADDGRTLIPNGGTSLGYLNPDGEWIERDELQPVGPDGEALVTVASSFDAPIALEQTASVEQLLDHSARLVYRLLPDSVPAALARRLAAGELFRFGFSYRGGVGHDPAFVFADSQADGGALWMLVTDANAFEPVGLGDAAVAAGESDDERGDENDAPVDFGML